MSAEELDPRPYFTLTNEYPRHRKVRGLSDKAFRLHVTLIALANEERNNGHVLGIDADMFGPRPRKELITAGLLHEAADGYQLHDYLKHQRSREQISKHIDKKRKAGAIGGRISNHVRNHKNKGINDPSCEYCDAPPPDLDGYGDPQF